MLKIISAVMFMSQEIPWILHVSQAILTNNKAMRQVLYHSDISVSKVAKQAGEKRRKFNSD